MATVVLLVPLVVAMAACGRSGFEVHPDASPDAYDGVGDGRAPSSCLGTGAFTNLRVLPNVNSTASNTGAEISKDELALYFNTNVSATSIVVSTRSTRADVFSSPMEVVLPGGDAGDPSLTGDNLELYFSSGRSGASCIYRASRAVSTVAFGAPVVLAPLCGSTSAGAAISADGLVLVYNITIDTFGEGDLYVSRRATRTDDFPVGARLANLPANVGYAWLSADQLRLYFEHTIGNNIELYSASRVSPTDDFTNIQPIAELDDGNSSNVDLSLDPSESTIYFSTNREGSDNIWTATRPCL